MANALAHSEFYKRIKINAYTGYINDEEAVDAAKAWLMEVAE